MGSIKSKLSKVFVIFFLQRYIEEKISSEEKTVWVNNAITKGFAGMRSVMFLNLQHSVTSCKMFFLVDTVFEEECKSLSSLVSVKKMFMLYSLCPLLSMMFTVITALARFIYVSFVFKLSSNCW